MREGISSLIIFKSQSRLVMNTRTTSSYIQFKRPFRLEGYRKTLPSGLYKVETEEEWIDGLTFTVLRRTQVRLHLHIDPQHPGITEIMILDNPKNLENALAKDKAMIGNVVVKGACALLTHTLLKGAQPTKFDVRALERADNEGML